MERGVGPRDVSAVGVASEVEVRQLAHLHSPLFEQLHHVLVGLNTIFAVKG